MITWLINGKARFNSWQSTFRKWIHSHYIILPSICWVSGVHLPVPKFNIFKCFLCARHCDRPCTGITQTRIVQDSLSYTQHQSTRYPKSVIRYWSCYRRNSYAEAQANNVMLFVEGFWETLRFRWGHEGGLHDGNSVFIKRDTRQLVLSLRYVRSQKKIQ